jgi:hypothetical protein
MCVRRDIDSRASEECQLFLLFYTLLVFSIRHTNQSMRQKRTTPSLVCINEIFKADWLFVAEDFYYLTITLRVRNFEVMVDEGEARL